MSDQPRRNKPADPTAERTAEQSTQTASGLSGGRPGPEQAADRDDDPLNRDAGERYETPRRYEGENTDPALPSDDATLNTKI